MTQIILITGLPNVVDVERMGRVPCQVRRRPAEKDQVVRERPPRRAGMRRGEQHRGEGVCHRGVRVLGVLEHVVGVQRDVRQGTENQVEGLRQWSARRHQLPGRNLGR